MIFGCSIINGIFYNKNKHKKQYENQQYYDRKIVQFSQCQCNLQHHLVGHVPIEISSLCYHFLKKSKTNNLNAVITGKRQREVGLVVPAKYSFETDDKKYAEILEKELVKRKELFPTVALKFKKKGLYRNFPVYNE